MTTVRRWSTLGPFRFDGLWFRVVRGKKTTALGETGLDLRLEVQTDEGWRPVNMRLGGLLADFFGENESVLYPTSYPTGEPTGLRGLHKYLDYLFRAALHGWRMAEEELAEERGRRS